MNKKECIERMLGDRAGQAAGTGEAFAPSNIALCKYWGKRDQELNLPETSSLSISLGERGTRTRVEGIDGPTDEIVLNGEAVDAANGFARRLSAYLDLFRSDECPAFRVDTTNTIPTAAGLASSASGFAALVLAMNDAKGWSLDRPSLSILARLGSGSACRSVFDGFVEWHRGAADDGSDSLAEPLDLPWPEFRIATVTISASAKAIGSREAMQRTHETARLYESWPMKVADDIIEIRAAIRDQDFELLGRTAESNALSMHATMIATWPPVLYWLPESVECMQRVWLLRSEGLPLYFTMDAGPNLKLLFEQENERDLIAAFPGAHVIAPFG